jgi:uncharacterized repeat protein (TIGR01451 family)
MPASRSRAPALEALEDRTLLSITAAFSGSLSLPHGANINVSQKAGGQAETTLAVNPTNPANQIACANDAPSIFGSPSQDSLWVTQDAGQTWTHVAVPLPVGAVLSHGDPTIVFDRTGRAVYAHLVHPTSSFSSGTFLASAVSTDGGQTWTAAAVTTPGQNGDDKDFLTVGPDVANPAHDRFYITWTRNSFILMASSADGLTWTAPVEIDDVTSGPGIDSLLAVGPAGEVYCVWEDYGTTAEGIVRFDRSFNGGVTWGTDQILAVTNVNVFDDPFTGNGFYTIPAQPNRGIAVLPWIDVDRSPGSHHGRVYVSFTDAPQGEDTEAHHDNTDIFLIASDNAANGTSPPTWNALGSSPVRINNDTGSASQFFASISVDQYTGLLGAGWYDARNDPNNVKAQFFTAVSADGGATFVGNQPVAVGQTDAGASGAGFDYGDYAGVAFFGGSLFPAWSDASNSTGNNPDGTSAFDLYTSRSTVQASGGETVTATGGTGDDTYTIRLDPSGTFVEFYENNPAETGVPTFTATRSALQTITVTGNTGNDTLVLDFSNGNPIPSGGISYDGGTGTNQIAVTADANFNLMNTALTIAGDGTVTLANVQTAVLTGGPSVNHFTVSNWSGNATLDGTGGGDFYTVGTTGGGSVAIIDSGSPGTDQATINGTPGADTITVTPTQTTIGSATVSYNANLELLTVNAQGSSDTFTVTPSATTIYTLDGGDPPPPASPGDTLAMNLAGTTGASLTATSDATGTQGTWTFTNAQPVSFLHMETLTPAADLAVAVSAPTTAAEGGTITYAITVTNNGPGVVGGVTLSDVLPAGTSFVSASFSQGSASFSSGTVTGNLGSLSSGGTVTGTIVLKAIEEGSLSNTVSVASPVSDPNSANNRQAAPTTVSDPAMVASGGFTVLASEGTTSGSQTVATFTDPGGAEALADYSAAIAWGDGTTTTGTVSVAAGVFTVQGSHTYADNGSYSLTVTIHHDSAADATANSSATVANVPPAALITGPGDGVPSQPLGYTVTATDPSSVDQAAGFSFTVAWGDGTSDTLSSTSPAGFTHRYAAPGSYTIAATATDKDGGTSPVSNLTVNIVVIELQGGDLAVGGTAGNDSFVFTPGNGASLDTVLNGTDLGTFTPTGLVRLYGGGGTDTATVNGTAGADVFVIDPTGVTIGSQSFVGDGVEKWKANGLAGNDTFTVHSGGAATLDGGTNTDTLIGPDVTNAWVLTAAGAGTLNGASFANFENLTGGAGTDTFKLKPAGSVTGTLNGGTGTADRLDFSLESAAVTVNLQTKTAPGMGHYANIEALTGSPFADTIIGANVPTTWQVQFNNTGKVGSYSFGSFENLTGGSANDTFKLSAGKGVSGTIDGGGGTNTLSYAAYTTAVAVDLGAGAATNLGGIANIQNVTGGAGNDTLSGNASDNILIGGAGNDVLNGGPGGNDILLGGAGNDSLTGGPGRSLLFGGGGADTITGGSDDDLLVAGTTNYDTNTTALLAILSEWQRTDADYLTRIIHLRNGTGLNGSFKLTSSTVHNDTSVDALTGGPGQDWFWASLSEITDLQSGEQVN